MKEQDRYLLQVLLAGSKKAIIRKWLYKESAIFEWIEIVLQNDWLFRWDMQLRNLKNIGKLEILFESEVIPLLCTVFVLSGELCFISFFICTKATRTDFRLGISGK